MSLNILELKHQLAVFISFMEGIFVYPFGLLRLWIIGKTKKSFKKIIQEHSFDEVVLQGTLFFLDLIAGAGALGLTIMLIYLIGLLAWKSIQNLIC